MTAASSSTLAEADLCVVGAGIVGLAHALEAADRGLRVVVCERDRSAAGASVRNFGHVFVSAMASGEPLDCARRARERWLELGARARLEVRSEGTLVLARHADELAVLEAAAAEPERGARLVDGGEITRLAPVAIEGVVGALHAQLDLRVDPRAAVGALAALLEAQPGATVLWGTPVHAVEEGVAHTARGPVRAERTVVCPGPDLDTLFGRRLRAHPGIALCKLQMQRVAAPGGRRYGPALLTGLSLLRYPGFAERPQAEAVRRRLSAHEPELLGAGIHLIVTQLPGGDLVVGDTHEYGPGVSPFGRARWDELVLAQASALLGVEGLEVRERWHGVYPSAPGSPFLVLDALPGVRVVEVVSGVGMTTALGLAPQVIDALFGAGTAVA